MALSKLDIIRAIPMFQSLTDAEANALLSRSIEKRYSAGEMLFHEGEECTGLYVIASGSVKIYKTSPAGKEIMLAVETAPSSVAEIPLYDGGPYPASVSAVSDVTVYVMPKTEFARICRENPDVPLKVLVVVGKRLRQLVTLVEGITFGGVRQRVARMLLELAHTDDPFELPFTHQEIALRLGTAREVVSRNLSRFQAQGLIRIEKKKVQVTDRPALELEAETDYN